MELLNIDATVEDCEHFIRSLAIDDSVYQNSDCSAMLANLMLCDRVIGWDRLSLIYCNAKRNKLALDNETKLDDPSNTFLLFDTETTGF